MRYWTWAEIKTKIESDCDIQDEDFIRDDELLGYANEAIDEAEAEIHTLYEDYFLKYRELSIVADDQFLSVATLIPDIYGDKIRRVIYREGTGTTTYTVHRMKDWKKFEEKALADTTSTSDLYSYFLINQTPGDPQIMLVPKAREAGTLTVWYLRNANRLALTTDVCDIPEFINFIFAHMRVKIYAKEGNPGYQEALERLEAERARMVTTLAARTPDAENDLEMDTTHYTDMN